MSGSIALTASEAFTQKNLHRNHAENIEAMKKQTALISKTMSRCGGSA